MSETFFSDIQFPEQYYGVLVRSPVERGYLVDIKPPRLPDGYHLYSATDIPGDNRFTAMGTTVPIFTPYEIQYYGEPLGILVGPELSIVTELVAEVLVETERLDPLSFSEKFTSSQVSGKRIIEYGDPEAYFERAEIDHKQDTSLEETFSPHLANDVALTNETEENLPRFFESIVEIGPQDHFYAEPLGAVINITKHQLDIFTPTQWPHHVRTTVSAVLDLDPAEIVVTPTALGEPMDGKIWFPSLIAAQGALAAVLCKHPVKITFSRHEDFLFSLKSAPVQIRYRTALASDGSIDAMIVRILLNSGAYSPLIDEIIDRITVACRGLYALRSWRVETYALRTNLPPMGILGGWGEGPAIFALENHIAYIINSRRALPAEWKLQNILSETVKELKFVELFHTVCTASDFMRKHTSYRLIAEKRTNSRDGPLRGIGISCGFQGNGFLGKSLEHAKYSVEVTMETDGRVLINAGFNSETMKQIFQTVASSIFGIEEHQIEFISVNTREMTGTGPQTLSSKISILAPLLRKCCETIQKQRFRQALPITVKKTWTPARNESWNTADLTGKPFISITPAVCSVELELDPLTYEPSVRGIWIACNAGKLHDRQAAMATLKKTISVALSRMLAEHIIIHDGKFIPKDSMQYDILLPMHIPELFVTFLESEEPSGGIGSIATNLLPAAYAAALCQITGKPVTNVPVDAQMIFSMLDSSKENEEE